MYKYCYSNEGAIYAKGLCAKDLGLSPPWSLVLHDKLTKLAFDTRIMVHSFLVIFRRIKNLRSDSFCKCQFHLLVILCNRTSPSERLGHVILIEVHSSLGQTSALHVFR